MTGAQYRLKICNEKEGRGKLNFLKINDLSKLFFVVINHTRIIIHDNIKSIKLSLMIFFNIVLEP